MEFNLNTTIRNKNIKFRKWKVKDKNKFIQNKENPEIIKQALVYDCIEDDVTLSDEEYKYMLMKIRQASISNPIAWIFSCTKCNETFEYEANLDEIMKPDFQEYGDLIEEDVIFTMGNIINQEFYDSKMGESTIPEVSLITDFVLHIKSINDNDGYSFDDIIDYINDMDVDVFEKIMEKWETMRFKVNNIHEVTCPHCNNVELYEFDDLPGFFPDNWNI